RDLMEHDPHRGNPPQPPGNPGGERQVHGLEPERVWDVLHQKPFGPRSLFQHLPQMTQRTRSEMSGQAMNANIRVVRHESRSERRRENLNGVSRPDEFAGDEPSIVADTAGIGWILARENGPPDQRRNTRARNSARSSRGRTRNHASTRYAAAAAIIIPARANQR